MLLSSCSDGKPFSHLENDSVDRGDPPRWQATNATEIWEVTIKDIARKKEPIVVNEYNNDNNDWN